MKYELPEDVKQTCLWIVRGHRRRIKRPRLSEDEKRRVDAVRAAIDNIGADIAAPERREDLRKAIMLNISSGRQWPYERTGLEGVSRTDFYRRKERFLVEVAERLGFE